MMPCPYCNTWLDISYIGNKIECKKCKIVFVLTRVEEESFDTDIGYYKNEKLKLVPFSE